MGTIYTDLAYQDRLGLSTRSPDYLTLLIYNGSTAALIKQAIAQHTTSTTRALIPMKAHSPLSTKTTAFTSQHVTVDTPLPPSEIIARLDQRLNRANASRLSDLLSNTTLGKDEFRSRLIELMGDNDFMFFSANSHGTWLNTYFGTTTIPVTTLYTLGNPLIAQTILKHNLRAGLYIPPRLLVLGKEDKTGTQLIYQLPSSVIRSDDQDNEELKEAVEALDRKLERFVLEVATVT